MSILTVVNSLLKDGLSLREACDETDRALGLPSGTTRRAVRRGL
jgi:hypothetical protein